MKRFSRALVVFIMLISAVGFAGQEDDSKWISCTLGCKFFYQECKFMREHLGLNDETCEEAMTSCNRMCYSMYHPVQ